MSAAPGAFAQATGGQVVPTVASLIAASGVGASEGAILAATALGCTREWLLAHDRDPLEDGAASGLIALLELRRSGMPIAYILGEREFYDLSFEVSRDVLIPRPETELLVDLAIEAAGHCGVRILDLGTGSGAIAITLAHRLTLAEVTAVDASAHALRQAARYAQRIGVQVQFALSDWYEALSGQRFDLILSNPPYIRRSDLHLKAGDLRYEPQLALVSGEDGLDAMRKVIQGAPAHLQPGGRLLVEHGYDQGAAVRALFAQTGFTEPLTTRDLAGVDRVCSAVWFGGSGLEPLKDAP